MKLFDRSDWRAKEFLLSFESLHMFFDHIILFSWLKLKNDYLISVRAIRNGFLTEKNNTKGTWQLPNDGNCQHTNVPNKLDCIECTWKLSKYNLFYSHRIICTRLYWLREDFQRKYPVFIIRSENFRISRTILLLSFFSNTSIWIL